MPTYINQTISATFERFALRQRFDEPSLRTRPETGEPVRRVMSGGLALLPNGKK